MAMSPLVSEVESRVAFVTKSEVTGGSGLRTTVSESEPEPYSFEQVTVYIRVLPGAGSVTVLSVPFSLPLVEKSASVGLAEATHLVGRFEETQRSLISSVIPILLSY
jgi:hypothetical protein